MSFIELLTFPPPPPLHPFRRGTNRNIVSNDYLKYLNKNPKSDDEEARQEQEKLKDHENFRNYK